MKLLEFLAYILKQTANQNVYITINGRVVAPADIRVINRTTGAEVYIIAHQLQKLNVSLALEVDIIMLAEQKKRVAAIMKIRETFEHLTLLEARSLYNHVLLTRAPRLFETAKV